MSNEKYKTSLLNDPEFKTALLEVMLEQEKARLKLLFGVSNSHKLRPWQEQIISHLESEIEKLKENEG